MNSIDDLKSTINKKKAFKNSNKITKLKWIKYRMKLAKLKILNSTKLN